MPIEFTALSSSATNFHHLHSTPFIYCDVRWCDQLWDCHGTSMLHRGHREWGRFPYYSITTVSWTCLCQKCIRMDVLIATCPLHPPTGQGLSQPLPETPSYLSWDCCPRRLRCPPSLVPPFPRSAGFGGAQPVTPSSSPSRTLGSSSAPAVYPCSSSLPSSSSGYRLSLPLPLLPGMGGIPSPRFS